MASAAGPAGSVKKAAHVSVQVFSDASAVVPGRPVRLLVAITPDEGWHIYWKHPGGLTGLPTRIEWTAPKGYRVGEVAYPVPALKHDKTLDEDSYVLEGRSLFPVTVNAPGDAPAGGEATFTAKVSWLACKKECIPGEAEVAISLPVVSAADQASPANGKLFEEAASALPIPTEKAEHVKIAARLKGMLAKPGEKAEVVLTAAIAAHHHMQSHKPLQDYLIPAVVFPEAGAGIELGEVAYPPGKVRDDELLGKLSEYGGETEFVIPVSLSEDAETAPADFRGVFQYQICNDEGTCFPPQAVEFAVALGGAKSASRATQATHEPTAVSGKEAPADSKPPSAPAADSARSGWLERAQKWFIGKGYWGIIVLAAMGGFVLNLMPCVLPVVSLKVLSFTRQAHESRGRIFLLGVAYCLGILTFFGLIAVLFRTTGTGWGEHFQNPVVVLVLAAVVTAFALSLFGVFTVFAPRLINKMGERAESREGLSSAFFTGVLATVLGTACTAPFLSAAVGVAARLPPNQGASVFIAVGAGMAAPFLFLAANPAWLRFVPRPGPWMGAFEAVMGFLLLGTVIWLLYPIPAQLGGWGMMLALIFLLGVALAAWIKGKVRWDDAPKRKWVLNLTALGVAAVAWAVPFEFVATIPKLEAAQGERAKLIALAEQIRLTGGGQGMDRTVTWDPAAWEERDGEIPWVPYDPQLVQQFVTQGYTVFVDFTADWCASCKTNLKTSIDIESVRALMRELAVVPFEADYTRRDPDLKRVLSQYDRGGVPLYLVFSPNEPDSPQILPELLTPDTVVEALKRAGKSKPRGMQMADAP